MILDSDSESESDYSDLALRVQSTSPKPVIRYTLPWGDLPATLGELSTFLFPDLYPNCSETVQTVDYTPKAPSPYPPEFSYEDDGIYNDLWRRWNRLIRGREGRVIGQASRDAWAAIGASEARSSYPIRTGWSRWSEDWVVRLCSQVDALVACLIADLLRPQYAAIDRPLHCRIQTGPLARDDASSILIINENIQSAFSVEHKSPSIFSKHEDDIRLSHSFSPGRQTGANAIIYKIMLRMASLEIEEGLDASQVNTKYGLIFTGHEYVVVERAEGLSDEGSVRGVALSKPRIVCGPNADTPFLAILLAMRFPIVTAEDPLTFLKPRDPGCLWPPLLESVLAGRTKRQTQEEEMIRTYMSPGIVPLSHPYMWLDYSLPGRSDPARLLCGLEPSELSASDASKSGKGSRSKKSSARSSTAPSPAFPPSSLSLSACPTSLDVPTSSGPRVGTIPQLHISGRISLGDIAQVFKGALDGVPVVFKSYPTPQTSDYLACEVAAYTRLRDGAVHVVPRLLGVYRLPGESWSGLLLEDVGSALGHAFWDDVALTVGEKQEIYEAIRAIHEAGVLHGDVEPRNIARASGGGPLRVIDFGSASMGHGCPGRGCRELRGLREALRMEDVREEDGAA